MFKEFSEWCVREWGHNAENELAELMMEMQFKDVTGDGPKWQRSLDALLEMVPSSCDLNADMVRVGEADQLNDSHREELQEYLMKLHPWRKGPYELFGLHIDTEWRSDKKWQRLAGGIQDLSGRRVLDVGCGNGYHLWRMRGAGAKSVLGIDPMHLFFKQFQVFARYIKDTSVVMAPCTLEQWPAALNNFDTVFSMGVYYHRRNPTEHLKKILSLMRSGGELVLETLVIVGDEEDCLKPTERYAKKATERYAKMRNAHVIPSVPNLINELKKCGFGQVKLLDQTKTTIEEQRKTPWMNFESLADFLDPDDPNKTIEGHPAPIRAVISATKP